MRALLRARLVATAQEAARAEIVLEHVLRIAAGKEVLDVLFAIKVARVDDLRVGLHLDVLLPLKADPAGVPALATVNRR